MGIVNSRAAPHPSPIPFYGEGWLSQRYQETASSEIYELVSTAILPEDPKTNLLPCCAMLKLIGVTKSYDGKAILNGISLT
ncbi:MAG: hypothetical protein M3Q00_14745, partial [Pseudomonadota bacterium]|nr:hypothetical protein [Pseudomonadota bacterium]